ncbi:hypothetical protein Taro_039314 [Colocasia esculenta]|uniref:Uncharacterized protein n=1 Tax=Colocasia esculenta TaxID=4460 RepID=A0A843WGB4_COLES|nr:hypothetical protein [Colocasia esculenta]
MYRKSNYIFQGPENTRVDKQTSTQQSKARTSVFDRISRIPIFDKLRATPSTPARPSKRRRVTWAAQEKPRLIIFSCDATGMESGEVAEQIAEATPNISTGKQIFNSRKVDLLLLLGISSSTCQQRKVFKLCQMTINMKLYNSGGLK